MSTGLRKSGDFCWINVITPQPEQARTFFGKVLGWTFVEMPGLGHGIQVGGRNIGGLYDLEGPNVPKNSIAVIGVMSHSSSRMGHTRRAAQRPLVCVNSSEGRS